MTRVVAVLPGLNPGGTGAFQRDLHLIRALSELGPVTVVVLGVASETARKAASERLDVTVIGGLGRARSKGATALRYLTHRSEPLRLARTDESRNQRLIAATVRDADLIFYRRAECHWIGSQVCVLPSVTDLDDVYSDMVEQLLGTVTNGARLRPVGRILRHVYLRQERRRWRHIERAAREDSHLTFVCSEADLQSHPEPGHIVVVPNGVESDVRRPMGRRPASRPRVGMWGLMSYAPNRDGAEWFAREIWPLVQRHRADVLLTIIGMGGEHLNLPDAEDIEVTGFVTDLGSVLGTLDVVVVPLRLGTGTRIKIIEAWAAGLPVVSTRIGAFGLADDEQSPLRLADEPDEFASAVVDLIEPSVERHRLIADGRAAAARLSWDSIRQDIIREVRSVLGQPA